MNDPVHILATVRRLEMLPAAALVFKTLRTGFPDNPVRVYGNALPWQAEAALGQAAREVGAEFIGLAGTSHDAWLESLVNREVGRFWVCDTDVVFWRKMPSAVPVGEVFSGRFEPEFDEEWTGTRHMSRLHTAVMRLDATLLRSVLRDHMSQIPAPWRNSGEFCWIRQTFVPVRGPNGIAGKPVTLFYDTMAGAYHALNWGGGARAFSVDEDDCFEHLHCGTYADVVELAGAPGLRAMHERVYRDVEAARGLRDQQAAYYRSRRPATPICAEREG